MIPRYKAIFKTLTREEQKEFIFYRSLGGYEMFQSKGPCKICKIRCAINTFKKIGTKVLILHVCKNCREE
jgi:hypothetical protein